MGSLETAIAKASSLLPPSFPPEADPPLAEEGGLEGGAPLPLGSPRDFPSLPPPLNPLLGQEGWGQEQNEIFIIGGGEIYAQGLPYTDKLYLTIVESDAQGDVFFPDWRKDFTKETFREERIDPKTGLKYTWIDLERNHGTNTE